MKSKLQFIAGATAVATLAAGFSMTAPVAAHAFAFKECKSFTLSGKGRRAVLKIAA